MAIEPQSERELASAVRQLTEVVRGLQDMMRHDYPKRDEIERDFVSKYGIKRRRIQYAAVTAVAIALSYFFSMATVSYCLLDARADRLTCQMIPGYGQAVESRDKLITRFNQIAETTEANQSRLDDIENELDRRGPNQ